MGVSNFRPIPKGRGGSRNWSRAIGAADTAGTRAQIEAATGRTVEWLAPPTGKVFDPAKYKMIERWEAMPGQRIFWTPNPDLRIEIARIGINLAVIPWAAYDQDDTGFHDYIRTAEPAVKAAYLATGSLLEAGDEIGWGDKGASSNAAVVGIGYEGRMAGHPEWPATLIFTVEELETGNEHVLKRPFRLCQYQPA